MKEHFIILYLKNELNDISFFEFVLLVLVFENEEEILQKFYDKNFLEFERIVKNLENLGYLKWHGDKISELSLRKRSEDLFSKMTSSNNKKNKDVNLWIDRWRNLFPEGVNPAGYRYRGNRLEVLKKMIKFTSSYPYSVEVIFEATKKYVDRFSIRGYQYMQQAHYFIEKKDVGSNLASECESLINSKTDKTQESPNYGRKVV